MMKEFDLSKLTNEELIRQLYLELSCISLEDGCKLIQKNIPRKMMYRVISVLYKRRTKQ